MAKITNFDTLKKSHDSARIAKVGSKAWIDFAVTMIDSFPALYETAKAMNERHREHTKLLKRVAGCIKDMGWDDLENDIKKVLGNDA